MMTPRKGAEITYERLLAAAVDAFAAKGYGGATIADICELAKANIAAVNYHFGDKETLYKKAWRYSFARSVKAHPPDGGVHDGAPPEERLRGRVTALLRRIADVETKEFLIVQKELANPTGLLDEIMREEIGPLQEKMYGIIRELIGPGASDEQVRFCDISIISQCITPIIVKREQKGKLETGPLEISDLNAYADHVVRFSLAGVREIGAESENRKRPPGRGGKSKGRK